MSPPPLTPTGRVILGMIALGNQTGYDIKQLVDKSTRHFWAASYGQIYPELRRLEERVRDLERLLGRKTMENEILKEALELARAKKAILLSSSAPRDASR